MINAALPREPIPSTANAFQNVPETAAVNPAAGARQASVLRDPTNKSG